MTRFAPAAFAALALAGCTDTLMSDARIRTDTAMALHQPASAVQIADRRSDGVTNTYYLARTPRGTFACTIDGGNLMSFGAANAPQCTRQ